MFHESRQGLANPPPGTVVDTVITKPEWWAEIHISHAEHLSCMVMVERDICPKCCGLSPTTGPLLFLPVFLPCLQPCLWQHEANSAFCVGNIYVPLWCVKLNCCTLRNWHFLLHFSTIIWTCLCVCVHRYDFFLASQSVRQGTVTPTHFNVIYDTSGLKPDHMQRLTYKLCHLYYNWPVSSLTQTTVTRSTLRWCSVLFSPLKDSLKPHYLRMRGLKWCTITENLWIRDTLGAWPLGDVMLQIVCIFLRGQFNRADQP